MHGNGEVPVRETPSKPAIRAELEEARGRYHRLVTSINADAWKAPTLNPKWTVGAVLAHVVIGLATVPLRLRSARQGRSIMVMPAFAFNFVNVFASRRLAMQHGPATIGREFDDRFETMLELLDQVRDDEWDRMSRVYVQQQTVEEIFRAQATHVLGHLAELQPPPDPS